MMVAQETLAQSQTSLQRVEITGSNIRRSDTETASPVQTISREEIQQSGKASVAEYLQTLAADNQGSVPTTFGNGFAAGASGISLRGMGAASTLVLINGRRVAPYGLADDGQKVFVDLNSIPMEAIERIEVLKDGASAIYGSDAIAGVVNVILRKNYTGATGMATIGQSRYGDGTEARASVTAGMGRDGTNFLFNVEAFRKDAIWNHDRKGRGQVGQSDLRSIGFDAETSGGANGGTGAIIGERGAAVSSVIGNVRNPATFEYFSRSDTHPATGFTRTFPTACTTVAGNYPQGDPVVDYVANNPGGSPNGGCLIDAPQKYSQIQPEENRLNLFARFSKDMGGNSEVYGELNLYKSASTSSGTPSGVSGSTGYPGGPVSNASVSLGAAHPDNPYFGTTARVRYLAADVGPRVSDVDSTFVRALVGMKGSMAEWDYDTGLLFSQNKVSNTRNGFLQRNVAFALLNPSATNVANAMTNPAYAALPGAGTASPPFWRIGENAGANSAALYAALSPAISNDSTSKSMQLDFKASREFGKLEGGPIGVAVGAEIRRESMTLEPTKGTDKGNIIGLGYSAYDGARTVMGLYGEALFPVTKQLELNAAVRADRYSDAGNSFTPKFGAKFRAADNLALRATYARGFRAPSPAENGKGGLAAFTTAVDPPRCALGVTIACSAGSVAIITSPNPGLEPEKSESMTLGMVWDVTPKTSMALDFWQIKRKGEINQETSQAAILAGHVVRDPTTALPSVPGDPGGITAILTNYINSSQSVVQGVDLDAKHRMDLGDGMGRLNFNLNWTHLFKWQRTDPGAAPVDYAGTHGNCDVTNCIGTPADRLSFTTAWEMGKWRVAATANYRGTLKNIDFQGEPGCLTVFANGNDAPSGCKISSFTTVDLSARWKLNDKTEVFGSIRNLFDRIPPLDPTTYGATSYNPLDYSGAVGRYFSIGVRHTF